MAVTLYGFAPSVYVRVARLVLAEKGVEYALVEVDPFSETPDWYAAFHPFGRVPALDHDGFRLHETRAITGYVDDAFDGPALRPVQPQDRARMEQIIAMIDAYGYWPLVRQVFVQRVAGPRRGRPTDETELASGLAKSRLFLGAVEPLIGDGPYLTGEELSLADLHLVPMTAYFTEVPEGRAMLSRYPKLQAWWSGIKDRPLITATSPVPPPSPSTDQAPSTN